MKNGKSICILLFKNKDRLLVKCIHVQKNMFDEHGESKICAVSQDCAIGKVIYKKI